MVIEYWYDAEFNVSSNTTLPVNVFLGMIWGAVDDALKKCDYPIITESKKTFHQN